MDTDSVVFIRVYPCLSVVNLFWLRLGRAALYRGLPTRWPFAVPTPRRLAIGDTCLPNRQAAGWQPAQRNNGSWVASTPYSARIGTMNRGLGAPISRSAHSGHATPRRAGARRSGSWVALTTLMPRIGP